MPEVAVEVIRLPEVISHVDLIHAGVVGSDKVHQTDRFLDEFFRGPLSKTDAQMTRGSVVVIANFIRSSNGFDLIASSFDFEMRSVFGFGCRHWAGTPLFTLAVPLMPVLRTTMV